MSVRVMNRPVDDRGWLGSSGEERAASPQFVAVLVLTMLCGCGATEQTDGPPRTPSAKRDSAEIVREAVEAVKSGKTDAIDLDGIEVTDDDLELLRGLDSLKKLHVGTGPTNITDAGLEPLQHLAKLEVLVLGEAPVTDEGLARLAKLPRLKHLNVVKTKITDRGLARLRTCRQLEFLRLGGQGITGAGLEHVTPLEELRFLILFDCPLGEDAVGHLKAMKAMPRLESLYLFGTRLSDAQLEEVHDELRGKIHVHY